MNIYNYSVYSNFTTETQMVSINNERMELIPEFSDSEESLASCGRLTYRLHHTDGRVAGRLLFPFMQQWKYEGSYFSENDLKKIGRTIYYWVGLWD